MPIYEYTCEKCGTRVDVLQKMDEPAPPGCSSCGADGTMARQVSRTSFVLKGGGWYSDLYGSAKKDSVTSSAPSTSTATSTSTTPATPAASDSTKKDSGGTGNSGGSTPPASGGTPSSSGGTPSSAGGKSGSGAARA